MRLIQYLDRHDAQRLGCTSVEPGRVHRLDRVDSMTALAEVAWRTAASIEDAATRHISPVEPISLAELLESGRVLPPLTHADAAHCLVSGTGLTHLGSASTRDAMHEKAESALTDSMRMFKWGLEGGRPAAGQPGVQPEWFYKGDGAIVVAPGAPLPSPSFALDAGEEPEVVGLYWIAPDGTPCRLGFALGNEFSDHVTERQNYLLLAHSKLRACAFGPELLTGPLPADLSGTSRIRRGDTVIWEKPFATGEANMSHTGANLEYHHFKYAEHRRPGDVHVHFFGTATLSFADGIRAEPGDRFEIVSPVFGAPLVNALTIEPAGFAPGGVRVL
jgi:hypothetical protein